MRFPLARVWTDLSHPRISFSSIAEVGTGANTLNQSVQTAAVAQGQPFLSLPWFTLPFSYSHCFKGLFQLLLDSQTRNILVML